MNEKWTTVNGIIQRGHQVASGVTGDTPYPAGTIEMQKPFFKALGLDLTPFFMGTLNISISPYKFTMDNPEYSFRQVQWTDRHPPEDFSFSRCRLIFKDVSYDGWVYYPHPETKKTHFQNPSIVEVITSPIPNLEYDAKIELALNIMEISLSLDMSL